MSIVTCETASCSGISWLTGPSRPVVATNAVMPRNSGTPAATAAPNAISRMISVPPIETCDSLASSARPCGPRAFACDASPCSSTSSSGCAFCTAATAASGASATVSSFARSGVGLGRQRERHQHGAAVLGDGVRALLGVERALDVLDAVDALRRWATSLTAAVT